MWSLEELKLSIKKVVHSSIGAIMKNSLFSPSGTTNSLFLYIFFQLLYQIFLCSTNRLSSSFHHLPFLTLRSNQFSSKLIRVGLVLTASTNVIPVSWNLLRSNHHSVIRVGSYLFRSNHITVIRVGNLSPVPTTTSVICVGFLFFSIQPQTSDTCWFLYSAIQWFLLKNTLVPDAWINFNVGSSLIQNHFFKKFDFNTNLSSSTTFIPNTFKHLLIVQDLHKLHIQIIDFFQMLYNSHPNINQHTFNSNIYTI